MKPNVCAPESVSKYLNSKAESKTLWRARIREEGKGRSEKDAEVRKREKGKLRGSRGSSGPKETKKEGEELHWMECEDGMPETTRSIRKSRRRNRKECMKPV